MRADVLYPDAWLAAKDARIKANANKTRRRKLEAEVAGDSDEFRAWLFETLPPALEALRAASQAECDAQHGDFGDERSPAARAYDAAYKAWHKRVGYLPAALRDAMDNWGGLTEKQLAWARREFAKNIERADGRDAEENARRARAPHWTAGRQTIDGTVQTARVHVTEVAWRTSAISVKALLLLDDGRKLWTSVPKHMLPDGETYEAQAKAIRQQRLTFAVTVEPSSDDPTMAFGSRPGEPKAPKAPRTKREKPAAGPQEPRTATNGTSPEAKREAKRLRAQKRREARRAAEGR